MLHHLLTGKKWTPSDEVQRASSALRHKVIVVQVQQGINTPTWSKATTSEETPGGGGGALSGGDMVFYHQTAEGMQTSGQLTGAAGGGGSRGGTLS